MRLGRPARGQPAASGRREDQRAALLADEAERLRLVDRAAPELEAALLEVGEQRPAVADEPELREADELLCGERPVAAVLLEPVVRDQLDDAAGGVVEVDGEGVPVVEVEDVAEHLDALSSPRECGVEA